MLETKIAILQALSKDSHRNICRGSPPVVIPQVGDRVRVLRGLHAGDSFEVVLVQGNVWIDSLHVFVSCVSESPVWYFAWDLEILTG